MRNRTICKKNKPEKKLMLQYNERWKSIGTKNFRNCVEPISHCWCRLWSKYAIIWSLCAIHNHRQNIVSNALHAFHGWCRTGLCGPCKHTHTQTDIQSTDWSAPCTIQSANTSVAIWFQVNNVYLSDHNLEAERKKNKNYIVRFNKQNTISMEEFADTYLFLLLIHLFVFVHEFDSDCCVWMVGILFVVALLVVIGLHVSAEKK